MQFLMLQMKNLSQATATGMRHVVFLLKDMVQVYQEETDVHLFQQGGVLQEAKLTDLEVISGPVLLIISWSRTSQLMDNLFLVFLLLCSGSNLILLRTVWELQWKCGEKIFLNWKEVPHLFQLKGYMASLYQHLTLFRVRMCQLSVPFHANYIVKCICRAFNKILSRCLPI